MILSYLEIVAFHQMQVGTCACMMPRFKKKKPCTDNVLWYSHLKELREFHFPRHVSDLMQESRGISPHKGVALFLNGYRKIQIRGNNASNVVQKTSTQKSRGIASLWFKDSGQDRGPRCLHSGGHLPCHTHERHRLQHSRTRVVGAGDGFWEWVRRDGFLC